VRSFLFQVSPFDPAVLILAAIGVFCLALGGLDDAGAPGIGTQKF
jgi:hypothetical protein